MTFHEFVRKNIMKTLFILFFFFVLLSIPMYSQDWKIIRGSDELKEEKDIDERKFVCTNLGCYVLFSNRLMISSDGCRTWQRSTLDKDYPDYEFKDMEFFDDFYGVISAQENDEPYRGFILRTTNGGRTWSNVFYFDEGYFMRFSYVNYNTMFVSTGYHTFNGFVAYDVYKSTDKGLTWDSTLSCLSCSLFFNNDGVGLISFANPLIGRRWSIVRGNSFNREGDFTLPNFIFNNSKNWKIVFDTMMYVFDEQFSMTDSMKFLSNHIAGYSNPAARVTRLFNTDYGLFAYFSSEVYETTDGGFTWKQVFDAAPHRILPDFFYTPWGIIGRSSDDNMFIINDTKRNPTLINTEQLDIYPNPSSSAISVTIPSVEVVIYSTFGEALLRVQDKYENIDIENLSTGYYIVKAVTPIGVYYSSFVKE